MTRCVICSYPFVFVAFWQLFSRLCRRSTHQFSDSCLPEAVQAQLSPIFRQLFFGGCAGAALTKFPAAAFFPEAVQAQLSPIFPRLFPEAVQAQATRIFWQVPLGAAQAHSESLTNFLAAAVGRLCRRSSDQFSVSCFPEAGQAQLSPIFLADVSRGLCMRSSDQFARSCFSEAVQAQLYLCRRSSHQFSGSCYPEAVQAQLSPIFPQLFTAGCAGASTANFVAAVSPRLRRRSSHRISGSCFPEALQVPPCSIS